MSYDSTKPASGGSPNSSDIRENFRALKDDGIVVAGGGTLSQISATISEINTVCDGDTAKNNHVHDLLDAVNGDKIIPVINLPVGNSFTITNAYYTSVCNIPFYIPSNAGKLFMRARMQTQSGGVARVRLNITGQSLTSNNMYTSAVTWTYVTGVSVDLSGCSAGWDNIWVELMNDVSGHTAYINGFSILWGPTS